MAGRITRADFHPADPKGGEIVADIGHGRGAEGSRRGTPRLLTVFTIAALVASACGSPPPSPTPSTALPASSVAPGTSPGPTSATTNPTPAPSEPPDDAWGQLDLPPLKPVASLTPTKAGQAGAAVDTAFRLRTLDGTSVATLASRLEVQPALELRRTGAGDEAITLQPARSLRSGTTYRFAIRRPDGTIAQTWSVVTAKSLRVVGTIPADGSTGVPRNTGIEFTFDQPGVTAAGVRNRFTITPKVSGRFEVGGKTVAFVPTKPLKAFTLYTVTLEQGVPLPGTGQQLEQDVRVRFETKGGAGGNGLVIHDTMTDSATSDPSVLAISFRSGDDEDFKAPTTLPLAVHRLGSLKAAMAAYRRLAAAPEWAWSTGAPIPTSDLALVLQAKVKVRKAAQQYGGTEYWVQFPQPLRPGWYVATLSSGGRKAQTLIQVSDLAAYAMVTETRSVVWVNALDDGDPVAGAAVEIAGKDLGRTDADGLRIGKTPAALLESASDLDVARSFVVVRDRDGRVTFIPVADQSVCGKCWMGEDGSGMEQGDAWWRVFASDRNSLRPTDHANVWGVVRGRADGSVPKRVEIRLVSYDDWTASDIAIAKVQATPNSTGMFTADLRFSDVPPGSYRIALVVGGDEITSTWAEIGPIVKPAWRIHLTADERAILSGDTVNVTATATFFEGTAVAGADLRLGTGDPEDGAGAIVTKRTGEDGIATAPLRLTLSEDDDTESSQWGWTGISANPTLPEEAAVTAETWVAVFRSTALIEADARVESGALTLTGNVHDVDFASMADAAMDRWDVDPAGAPRAGATVSLQIKESIPTRKQIGTAYDWITKTTSPVYEYDQREVDLGTRTATTAADGTFRLTMPVGGGDHSYWVVARYRDEAGRQVSTVSWATAEEPSEDAGIRLVVPAQQPDEELTYAIGERVQVEARGGNPVPDRDRYLFTVTHLGLQSATVQRGDSFSTTFRESWIPNASLRTVRFNGTIYEATEPETLSFDTSDRAIDLDVTSDSARYEPGDHVRVHIRARDKAGEPVAASVVVRVVDEKLFAIAAASDIETLQTLYAWVGDGVVSTAWSHGAPADRYEGGDTGGGGDERAEFRDWLVFRLVRTGTDGRATVEFDLSDDLTSWHVSASAVTAGYRAGDGTLAIPVGLPFFVETAIAQEYLEGDRPVLRLRGYGAGLDAGDAVDYTVTATSLGMGATKTSARAFTAASLSLPALTKGDHRIRIVATTGSGSSRREDVLIRTIHVVASRASQARTASGPLVSGFQLQGGATGKTTVMLTDGGRGRALPILLEVGGIDTGRADQVLAAELSRVALHDLFGVPEGSLPISESEMTPFQVNGGVALLPYASPDVELSALAALAGDERIDQRVLSVYFHDIWSDEATRLDRQVVALAGMAATGQPVLVDIRRLARNDKLDVTDRSWLAVAALAAGDEALAGDLERAVLQDHGQRLGPWIRVNAGDRDATATTTALLAITAAGIGDPLAADMDAYVAAYPPIRTLVDLQRAIAARSWAERTPTTTAVASLRVQGVARQLTIDAMDAIRLTLTPDQLASATISPVSGTVIVTTSWEGPLDAASMRDDGIASFKRTVSPSGAIPVDGVVVVEFTVGLDRDADDSCWRVTDLVPSGLAPISGTAFRADDEDEETTSPGATVVEPWSVVGQRVDFCVVRDPKQPIQRLRYIARVVTPGTYGWEPAVIQSTVVPEHGAVLPARTLIIRDSP